MRDLYQVVPREDGTGKLAINLHPGQVGVWDSAHRFTAMLAGTQSGKTSFGPLWLYREIYGFEGDPLGGRGAGDYLAVTSTYDLFKLKMLPAIMHFFCDVMGVGRYWAGDKVIELADPASGQFKARRSIDPMWGRIILRSASSEGGLESATAKAAWLDEVGQDDFSLEAWEAVLRRLSLAQGRALLTTTVYNLGWLKTEFYDRWTDGDPDYNVVQFPSYYNPAFPYEEYQRAKRTLPEWRFQMFYRGMFARPAGLIYRDFTDDMLVDPFKVPSDWRRVVGVDFGGANLALLWLAQHPKTLVWYAYRDQLVGGLSTPEYVGGARALIDAEGATDVTFVGGSGSEGQERRDWTAAGLRVEEPPIGEVEPGISRVIGLIRKGQFRVFRNLRGLRDELGSYRRKLDDSGQPLEDIVDKRLYHRLDALRYAVSYIEGEPGGGFLF